MLLRKYTSFNVNIGVKQSGPGLAYIQTSTVAEPGLACIQASNVSAYTSGPCLAYVETSNGAASTLGLCMPVSLLCKGGLGQPDRR